MSSTNSKRSVPRFPNRRNVLKVKPLELKLGISFRTSREGARLFRKIYKSFRLKAVPSTDGMVVADLRDWRAHKEGLKTATSMFLAEHGQLFWPDDNRSLHYKENLQLSRDRKTTVLHQLLFRKNCNKHAANHKKVNSGQELTPNHAAGVTRHHSQSSTPTQPADPNALYDDFDTRPHTGMNTCRNGPRPPFAVMRADSVTDDGSQGVAEGSGGLALLGRSDGSTNYVTTAEPQELVNEPRPPPEAGAEATTQQARARGSRAEAHCLHSTGPQINSSERRRSLRGSRPRQSNNQADPEAVQRYIDSGNPDRALEEQTKSAQKRKHSGVEEILQNKRRHTMPVHGCWPGMGNSCWQGATGVEGSEHRMARIPSAVNPTTHKAMLYHQAAMRSTERDGSATATPGIQYGPGLAPTGRRNEWAATQDRQIPERQGAPSVNRAVGTSATPTAGPPVQIEGRHKSPRSQTQEVVPSDDTTEWNTYFDEALESTDTSAVGGGTDGGPSRPTEQDSEDTPHGPTAWPPPVTIESVPDEALATPRSHGTALNEEYRSTGQRSPAPEPEDTIASPLEITSSGGAASHQATPQNADARTMRPPPPGPLGLKPIPKTRFQTTMLHRSERGQSCPPERTQQPSSARPLYNPSPLISPAPAAKSVGPRLTGPDDGVGAAQAEKETAAKSVSRSASRPPSPTVSQGAHEGVKGPLMPNRGAFTGTDSVVAHPDTHHDPRWSYLVKTSVETYVWDPECSFEELTRDGLIEKVKRDTGLDLDNRRTRGISIAMEGPGMKGPRQLFRLPHGRPEDFVTLRNEMKKVARQAVRRSRARGFAGDLEYELKIQAWTDELKREQLKECSY